MGGGFTLSGQDQFLAALSASVEGMTDVGKEEIHTRAERLADRMRSNLTQIEAVHEHDPHGPNPRGGMLSAIRTRRGTVKEGPYVDVGIIPGSGKVTETGESVDSAAIYDEFGHREKNGQHVPPYPWARAAIADELAGPG